MKSWLVKYGISCGGICASLTFGGAMLLFIIMYWFTARVIIFQVAAVAVKAKLTGKRVDGKALSDQVRSRLS